MDDDDLFAVFEDDTDKSSKAKNQRFCGVTCLVNIELNELSLHYTKYSLKQRR